MDLVRAGNSLHSMNPSLTTCPARVAVMDAACPLIMSASAKRYAKAA